MTTLDLEIMRGLQQRLGTANQETARQFPGDSGVRQPVHTVYGGAHLFRPDSAARLGRSALQTLDTYAGDAMTFARALGLDSGNDAVRLAETVFARVVAKLQREPVEDFRIDFEDGYGARPDAEEDGHATADADHVANALRENTLPPFIGIRIKPLTEEVRRRSLRTLELFLSRLVAQTGRALPPNFVVTLPKITHVAQVSVLADALEALETALGLAAGAVRIELMVETPQSIFGPDGEIALPQMVRAANGRVVAAHFGTYDYTAACGITAAHQHMTHPACDFAKHVMQVALAGTGVWLSDGATNVMPVPVHRTTDGRLTDEQIAQNRASVHAAWKLHYEHVRHSLVNAFYQGWDLHPAQLPTRYAAVYGFFLESLPAAAERLRNFVSRAAQATLIGDVFDDAATGQGLLNYFLRAINCGAVNEGEVVALTGLALDDIRTRSFVKILERRRGGG